MKLDDYILKRNFEINTYVYENTMLEGEIPKEDCIMFEKNTNIKVLKELNYENNYCITYIDKEGYMYSKINLNKYEIIKIINNIKNKIDKGMINIFDMKKGIIYGKNNRE